MSFDNTKIVPRKRYFYIKCIMNPWFRLDMVNFSRQVNGKTRSERVQISKRELQKANYQKN